MTIPYSLLAKWYDQLYSDDFYNQYAIFIQSQAQQYKISKIDLLDVACGTGRLLSKLVPYSVSSVGIDSSAGMLAEARKKLPQTKFHLQNMTAIRISGMYNVITCTFDSLNYVLNIDDVQEYFRNIKKLLKEQGIFIFDFNTIHKKPLGLISKGKITYKDRTHGTFWDINIHTPSGQEFHHEKLYTLEEIKHALEVNGMHIKKIYSNFSTQITKEDKHPRIIVVAQ
ncbi:MAG: hypothetical protein A3G57_01715 [Candidatus Andersenbacteria bacterium RIFCSPLOWO2_12_FULL_45_8]|jgi:ubiquinone/menaquinone biosynthesis C-methylase UbiE|nr:MAG: S-adenosylmethionine-dependent methyltransferase [Parcubacteria group bacterium GW2011_GWA2_45_14]OGY33567.1 MAG: hypothetical protein A3B76_05965 [Candidatus Andersenbacteria bacterium RIFCSPHIGHO2_02_FULL_46_16]OGY42987.1 MAG: hypothetical protein A3G57_01715 [Candidatus Andersenbacteria bacterium RIFCSPLOWO2_12_FULL_45_8]